MLRGLTNALLAAKKPDEVCLNLTKKEMFQVFVEQPNIKDGNNLICIYCILRLLRSFWHLVTVWKEKRKIEKTLEVMVV